MISLNGIFKTKQKSLSCDTITLDHFIDILYGYKPEPSNWQSIFSEYQSLVKDEKSNNILSLLIQISTGENQIVIMNNALHAISVNYTETLAKSLRKLFPRIKFAKNTLKKDIETAINIMKSRQVKLNEAKSELEKERKKSEGNKSSGKNSWISTLVTLSKYQGYQINIKTITVSEYCLILNNFKEYQLALKNNGKQRENR